MDDLRALFEFPTVFFSILLLLVILYWVLVILGALDNELLDSVLRAGEDAAGSGNFLTVLGLSGVPAGLALSLVVLLGWLATAIGARGIAALALPAGPLLTLLQVLLLGLSTVLAVILTGLFLRPLQRLLHTPNGHRGTELIGKVCTIKTLRVDEKFGQAEYADRGAGLLIQVRARPEYALGKGARALIIAQDIRDRTYQVIPYEDAIEEDVFHP
jgi:hypothetical protein